MSKVIDALGRIKALCQGYVKDSNDDWNPIRGDYKGGVFAGPYGSFYDTWVEQATGTKSGGAGDMSVATTDVPSGYLYVLQLAHLWHTDGTARKVDFHVGNGYNVLLAQDLSLAGLDTLRWSGEVVLKEGDNVNATVYSIADGKSMTIRVRGYKVRL